MAKQKTILTLEEKLQNALVPPAEQPYVIPDNWVWTRLGEIAKIKGGKRLPQGHKLTETETEHPYLRVADFGYKTIKNSNILYIKKETFEKIKNYTISSNDVYISIAGTIGKVGIIPPLLNNANLTENAAKITNIKIYKHYIMWQLSSDFSQNQIKHSTKVTTQPKLALFRIEELPFPLPPLAEQERIVSRIESLFAKLDEAKELAENALATFEERKSALLHQAFSGELTKQWRENNGVTLDSWEEKKLGEVCKISSGGTPSRSNPEYFNGKIPWVKTGEINWNYLIETEEHITEDAIENSSAKLFPIGTVLVAMYGMGVTRGRASILDIEATTNQAVCALKPNTFLNNRFLYFYFMNNYNKFRELSVGGNQLNLSGKIISSFSINLPSLPEQQEIVRILDTLFEKEGEAKDLVAATDKIDTMKKAILARAFRGELGTNVAEEESAVKLLEAVLETEL